MPLRTDAHQHTVVWLQALATDVERLLAAHAQQHISLEHARGQRSAMARIRTVLNTAYQAEDILKSYEPGYHRQEEADNHGGIAIGHKIGIHTQREARA